MRLRYTLLLGAVGFLLAWLLQQMSLAYFALMGCCALFSLRCIEYQIGDLKGRLGPTSAALDTIGQANSRSMAEEPDPLWRQAFGIPNRTAEHKKPPEPRRASDREWMPIVTFDRSRADFLTSPATSTPLKMRKRDSDGNWIYRDPTDEEIREYIEAEGW